MAQKSDKISFVTNATTKEALAYIVLYSWVVVRNIGKAIDRAVHRLPWLFIALTALIATIVSIVSIGQARAERDSYNKTNVHLQQQLDSYKACFDNGKEVF